MIHIDSRISFPFSDGARNMGAVFFAKNPTTVDIRCRNAIKIFYHKMIDLKRYRLPIY